MRTPKPYTVAIVFLFFGILQSTLAFAACTQIACRGQIERILMDSRGIAYIATDGDEQALNCTSPGGTYITMTKESSVFNQQYALLLTAQSLGQEVGLRIVEGSSNCTLSYILLDTEE